ncbi:MAG: hypothetical protein ACTSO7_18785, partial [Candidatus Heimdallarchaeota archaeon]
KTLNCTLHQRCEGIYQIMLNLGAGKKDANSFSKYVWRRSFVNKFKDTINDSSSSFGGNIIKAIAKLAVTISKPLVKDVYDLENNLSKIENQIFSWEKKNESIKPKTYFTKSGEGYGLMFKKAALLSNCSDQIVSEMNVLGQNLGILVTMRDSIQDKEMDKKYDNYNPFLSWSKNDIISYYQNYRKKIAKDIIDLINANDKAIIKKNETNVFRGLSVFSLATTSPYGLCRNKIQALIHDKSSMNLPIMSYMVEPPQQLEEDKCSVNCCAPTCDECCHIPNNPCGFWCECCDMCTKFCDVCANCLEPCQGCSC